MYKKEDETDSRYSQIQSRVSTIASSTLRKYPVSMVLKLAHLIVFDIINITFCALNRYSLGIIFHAIFAILHLAIFGLDLLFRKKNLKFEKKCS